MKDVLDTSLPTSSASDMKTVRVPNQDDDQYLYKLLDGLVLRNNFVNEIIWPIR